MSDQTTTEKAPSKAQVQKVRAGFASDIREALRDEKRAALRVGIGLLGAAGTFGVTEQDEWKVWATTVTGKSFKTCQSYMAVARTHEGMASREAKKVESWTFEALQALAATPEDDRHDVVAKIGSTSPTPEQVRETRTEVHESKIDPDEAKKAKAERAKRERENAAERTLTLAKDIRGRVSKLANQPVLVAMAGAAQIAQDHKGKDVAAAINLIREQAEAKAKADAAKIAKAKAEGKAEAKAEASS